MSLNKTAALLIILILIITLQGCSSKTVEEPVKLGDVIKKVKIDSEVSHQETNWVRVTGTVTNSSELPVVNIEVKLTLTAEGSVFDTRLLMLSNGKVLLPGQTMTFDSTFDYGSREIPQLVCDAKIINLDVRPKQ